MKKIVFLMLLIATPVSAGIYKWTDSDGNIHFGDRPVDLESATELKIKTNNRTGVTNSSSHKADREYLLKKIDEDKAAAAEKNKERIASNKKRRKQCDEYKSAYHHQIQSNQLYTMGPDGKRTYLSDKERAARKKKLTKGISKNCR